jgi:hypothetical protein
MAHRRDSEHGADASALEKFYLPRQHEGWRIADVENKVAAEGD